jgi:transcription initiation factor TFIID TATA-box-binding protein
VKTVTAKRSFEIEIQNVVASVTINQRFDLIEILKVFRNAEYNPKRFPGLVIRIKQPKAAILIFSSGKMVCAGTKSEAQAKKAVYKIIEDLKDKGIKVVAEPEITIQNMVASANLQKNVDLEAAADLLENIMYEPEQFPGLIYRMRDPKTVLLIFTSGKLVCAGAKNEDIINESVIKLHEILDDYDLFYSN